ncbi:MAG: hypothetical protein ACPG47_07320, partial [Leucothrix sp.]
MYLALLKLVSLVLEAVNWIRLHALRYFASPMIQSGSGNVGERAAKLPLSDWRYPITVVIALFEAVVLCAWQIIKWLFFFNTRSIFEFFLSGVKVVIVVSVLSIFGLYGYLSGASNPDTLRYYKSLHQQNTATALLGAEGKLIGAVPNPLLASNEQALGSLYTEMVPPVYWDILDYKTKRQLDFDFKKTRFLDVLTWRTTHYKGISLTGLFNTFNPFAKSPADSLVGQLAVNLNGGKQVIAERCTQLLAGLCRTLSSIHLAKHVFPYLAENKGAEFKRWTAIHGNLRGYSNDIAGLRATADVIFDKKPEQLNNAEQALMAVAQLHNQPLLSVQNLPALKEEAVAISRELYAQNQPALASNIEQDLLALKFKHASRSHINNQATFDGKLSARSSITLGNFTDLVQQRLTQQYQQTGNQRLITDAQITLPVSDNAQFKQRLLSRLKNLQQQQCADCGLNYTLGAKSSDGGAMIEILVSNQEGQIVRYFKRGHIEERAMGALSSIPAAVLLTTLGNAPDSLFCNQTYRDLPSSVDEFPRGLVNCETPTAKGHSLNFQQAVQVRASLPLFYALRKQASTQQLQALYKHFGLTDLRTKAGDASHGEQLAYEMSYGVVQSTPLHQLETVHQLGEALYGQSKSKKIVGISQFLASDLDEDRRYLEFNKTNSSIDLSDHYLRTQSAKTSLRQLLSFDTNSR